MLEASDLLRAVVREMPPPDDGPPPDAATLLRERHLSALLCDELARAAPVKLGVDLPHDKRLRQLCEAVLADPRATPRWRPGRKTRAPACARWRGCFAPSWAAPSPSGASR